MASRIENETSFSKRITEDYQQGGVNLFKTGSLHFWSTPGGKIRRRRRVEMIKDLIAGSDMCLEIGCADGGWSAAFSPVLGHLHAIDISPDFLEFAKERNLSNVTFDVMDANRMLFPDNTFDAIFCISTLHHLEIDRILPELHRVLKPGGKFVGTEPNMMNPLVALERSIPLTRRMFDNTPDETAFFRRRLKRQFEKFFEIEELYNFDFYHPAFGAFDKSGAFERKLRVLERIPIIREFSGSLFIHLRKPF